MINLIGTQECKVDFKGRFLFPSSFKNQLKDELKKGFVIKRGVFDKCLELYPMSVWNVECTKINKLNRYVKQNNEFIRKFMEGTKLIELDGTGRVQIPKALINFGSIKKDIVLASMVDRIEIWDKEEYEKTVEYQPDDFSKLTQQVMGKDEDEQKTDIS